MGLFEFLTAATVIGCATAVVRLAIERAGDARRRDAERRAEVAEARVADLQAHVSDLHHRSAELERNLDWTRRLMDAGGPPRAAREGPPPGALPEARRPA